MSRAETLTQDRSAEVAALTALLDSAPETWARTAPRLLERVGSQQLAEVVRATRSRLGGISRVVDARDGMHIEGPRGHVLAWAHLDDEGQLAGLLISRARTGVGRFRAGGTHPLWWASTTLPLGSWYGAWLCWGADSRWGWAASAALAAAVWFSWLAVLGFRQVPQVSRLLALAGSLALLASGARLSSLPLGDGTSVGWVLAAAAYFAGLASVAVAGRRHRWGVGVSTPLRFPLRGEWYVVQGGGRFLNHHYSFRDQRAAVDLVRTGRWGTRTRAPGLSDLRTYAAYGQPVYSPCDGVVASTFDALEDQVPGGPLRYCPPAGNSVVIDTGAELVRLCHLRPGTVTVGQGDVVKTGQLVGQVGNSGNSSEPHLHVQADRDGVGLDLAFEDVRGPLARGRVVRT